MIGEVRKVRLQVDQWLANVMSNVGKGQAWGHGTPDFDAQSGRDNKKEILKAL